MENDVSRDISPAAAPGNARPLRLLLVEDSENDAVLTIEALRLGGFEVVHARIWTPEALQSALREGIWDIVISDYFLTPGFTGLDALRLLKESGSPLPFLLISGILEIESSLAAIPAGAADFIRKDDLSRLAPIVRRLMSVAKEAPDTPTPK